MLGVLSPDLLGAEPEKLLISKYEARISECSEGERRKQYRMTEIQMIQISYLAGLPI